VTTQTLSIAPAATAKKPSCHHADADKPYLPYFLTAMAIMLVGGIGWGSALLIKLIQAGKYTGLSLHEMNAHGHAMLSGFIQLFIIGFAYQAFPRLLGHPLVKPRWCRPILAIFVVGLLTSVVGQLLNGSRAAPAMVLVGDSLELLALLGFAGQLAATFRQGKPKIEAHLAFIGAAIFFMVVSAGFAAWLHFVTLTAESRMEVVYYVSTYQPALRYLQLHGITLLMILGVGHRLLTNFYAFKRTSNRWMFVSLAILVASVLAEAGLFIAFRTTGEHWLAAFLLLPWLGLIAGSMIVAWRWRLWRRPRDQQGRTDRMGRFVQASFAWLAVSLLMTIALPFWSRAIGTYFSHDFYGATRQAFVFGFATLMIIAFTLRIVPTLNSIVPTRLKPMRATFWCLNIGCATHIAGQVVGEIVPAAHLILPIAIGLQFGGIVSWVLHLLWCIREGRAEVAQPVAAPQRRLLVINAA
jgi:hypothetical protein